MNALRRIAAGLLTLSCLSGCAASRSLSRDGDSAQAPTAPPAIFAVQDLEQIPAGRFCRVNSHIPNLIHEGTILRSTSDSVALTEVVILTPREAPFQLPLGLTNHLFRAADVEIPDGEVVISRESISSIEVYNETGSERLAEKQARWRKSQKRIRQELATAPEFPSSG